MSGEPRHHISHGHEASELSRGHRGLAWRRSDPRLLRPPPSQEITQCVSSASQLKRHLALHRGLGVVAVLEPRLVNAKDGGRLGEPKPERVVLVNGATGMLGETTGGPQHGGFGHHRAGDDLVAAELLQHIDADGNAAEQTIGRFGLTRRHAPGISRRDLSPSGLHCRQLCGQFSGQPHIVAVQERDPLVARRGNSTVPRTGRAPGPSAGQPPNTVVADPLHRSSRVVSGAIVANQDLDLDVQLRKGAADGCGDERFAVKARYDDRNGWARRHQGSLRSGAVSPGRTTLCQTRPTDQHEEVCRVARLARTLTIPLQGGLGNQLFEVAAGLAAGSRLDRRVRFTDYWLRNPEAGETARDLAVAGLLDSNELVHGRVARVGGLTDRLGNHHVVERHSADDALSRVGRLTCVAAGYFQHLAYVEEAWPAMRTRIAASGDPRLTRLLRPEAGEHGALHYRLGDYVANAGANRHHGVTAPGYFADTITDLSRRGGPTHWRIISDDPATATRLVTECPLPAGIVVEPATSADEWDDLQVLATARACVISNSSFSWWAAYLGWTSHGATVVAPQPWFADRTTPEPALFPSTWQRRDRSLLVFG